MNMNTPSPFAPDEQELNPNTLQLQLEAILAEIDALQSQLKEAQSSNAGPEVLQNLEAQIQRLLKESRSL
jgi:ribosomal protein S15P/S13E